MPLFALIAHDKKDDPGRRLANRPAHLEHNARLDASGRIQYGGPLIDEKGQMSGSLIIIEANDLEEAQATFKNDPYIIHGVFEEYKIVETKRILPRTN